MAKVPRSVATVLSTVVLIGKVVGMGVFVLTDVTTSWGGLYRVAAMGMAGICVALAFVAYRHPAPVVYVVAAVSSGITALVLITGFEPSTRLFGLSEVALLAIAASDMARKEKPAGTTAGVAAAAFGIAMVGLRFAYVESIIVLWLVLAIAVSMGVLVRWAERNREITEDVTRREERLAIARELHDGIAHHVTGIVVQAQAALATGGDDPARLRTALESIEKSGSATMASMRRLVDALRSEDAPLAPVAGVEDLEDLIEEARRGGLRVEADIDPGVVTPAIAPSVYRIVQEALTNVRRHGRGVTSVRVEVAAADEGARVTVVDDGEPVERTQRQGHGLTGMQERVSALGGHFWAGPRPGRGWSVRAWIPLEKRR